MLTRDAFRWPALHPIGATRAALILAAVFSAPVAHAQSTGPAAQITRLYRLSDQATDARDAGAATSLAAADYVFIGPRGDRHDRAKVLSGLAATYAQMRTMGFHTRTTTRMKSVLVNGDHAEVLFSQHQVLRHATRTLALDSTGRDRWARTPGGWRLHETRVLTVRQDRPTASLLSPQELAALNTLISVRNRAALQNLSDSVGLFNQSLSIDQSINDASSQQIREEEQSRRHREAYGP